MSKSTQNRVFDFSELSQLACEDPAAFEIRREQILQKTIDAMPESRQQRMRCLQWRIDQERNQSKTPMAACLKISKMMWDNVLGENGLLDTLKQIDQPSVSTKNATILTFPQIH